MRPLHREAAELTKQQAAEPRTYVELSQRHAAVVAAYQAPWHGPKR
jgi:hypothetical protein